MLTKTEFKEFVEAQRYLLLSLIGAMEIDNKELIKENIELLWQSTDAIAGIYNIELKSIDDMIQCGREIRDLEEMYNA